MTSPTTLNAFTVDVEDYFQVTGFERQIARTDWDSHESRVVASTHKVLEVLASVDVRGTFFVLGWVANRFPKLVREIYAAGHELASHSYWHRLVYSLTPAEFRQDLADSRKAIEDAAGIRPVAYRAPSFSITAKSLWALDILADEGFTIDSSIFPTRHDRYGIPNARADIHDLELSTGTLTEFPPTVSPLAGMRLPAGGGGYFRLYPWQFSKYLLGRLNQAGTPFMFYIHPWEVDPQQPRLPHGSRFSRFRHYVNLKTTEQKLRLLLEEFRFGTMSEVLDAWRAKRAGKLTSVELATSAN
ncbi:XrtA system polysaccharide deacetylase [Anatilimnocola sp. NA78]|uniref:XrtA system polysaccharide deacetylase n=1 Tax=Anatilimnocola sp. NA78 TaxID=3415683 RepID=UPI003CE57D4B